MRIGPIAGNIDSFDGKFQFFQFDLGGGRSYILAMRKQTLKFVIAIQAAASLWFTPVPAVASPVQVVYPDPVRGPFSLTDARVTLGDTSSMAVRLKFNTAARLRSGCVEIVYFAKNRVLGGQILSIKPEQFDPGASHELRLVLSGQAKLADLLQVRVVRAVSDVGSWSEPSSSNQTNGRAPFTGVGNMDRFSESEWVPRTTGDKSAPGSPTLESENCGTGCCDTCATRASGTCGAGNVGGVQCCPSAVSCTGCYYCRGEAATSCCGH
jgi:hypothetical protein